eukprot:gene17699-20421_t
MFSHRFNNHSNSEDEVEYVLKDIEENFIDWLSLDMNQFAKRKRIRRNRVVDFTETPWALDFKVLESQKEDADTSYEGRQFRRKFRVPFSVFKHLCKICVEKEVFDKEEKNRIPVYLKLMASLRILSRDTIAQD